MSNGDAMPARDLATGHQWPSERAMLRLAGVCALITAITTLLLWWLPKTYSLPDSFADRVALVDQPAYIARLWINFIHVMLATAGYAGAAFLIARLSSALAWAGFVALLCWAFAEALALSLNIWAQNAARRAPYPDAAADIKVMIETALFMFQRIWDGIFFIVLVCFLLGSLFLGMGAYGGARLQRIVAVLLLPAVPLAATIMPDGYCGFALTS